MPSFGDVSIGLVLDTSVFNQQISEVEKYSKNVKDIAYKVNFDSDDSFKDLKQRVKEASAAIDIPIAFGNAKQQTTEIRKEIEQGLKHVPLTVKLATVPVVEVRSDTRKLERDTRTALLRVQSDFGTMKIPVKLTGVEEQVAKLKQEVSAAIAPIKIQGSISQSSKLEGLSEKHFNRLITALESSSQKVSEEVKKNTKETKPVKGIIGNAIQGFQQGIGYTYAEKSVTGVIRGIEKTLNANVTRFGELVGKVTATAGKRAGMVVSKGLGLDGIVEDIGRSSSKIKTTLKSFESIFKSDVIKQRSGEFETATGDLVEAILTGSKDTREAFEKVKESLFDLATSPAEAINARRQQNIATTQKEVASALGRVDRSAISGAIQGKKGLILTSQGFTPEGDIRSKGLADAVGAIAGEEQAVVPLKSQRTTGVRYGFADSPVKGATSMVEALLQEGILDKYSEDVVDAVAQIITAREENPELEITVVGHSRGGMLARDIVEASQRLGIQGVKGASLASPSFGVAKPQNFTALMGASDILRPLAGKKSFTVPSVAGHQQADYFYPGSPVAPLLKGVIGGKTYTQDKINSSFNFEDAIASGITGSYTLYEKVVKKQFDTDQAAPSLIQRSIKSAKKTLKTVADTVSGEKELSEAVIEAAPATQKALHALASPFRIYKKVKLTELMRKAEELSKTIEVPDIDPNQYKSVGFVTGGVMQEELNPGGVENTQFARKTIQPLVPDTLLVDAFNPWSQNPQVTNPIYKAISTPLDTDKGLLKYLPKDLTGGIVGIHRRLQAITKQSQFTSAVLPNIQGGYNPDAVNRLAHQIAYAKKYPTLPQTGFSFSGGAFSMEPATDAANRMGIPTKAVALAAPMMGITATASPKQFQGVIGSVDPLALGVYGKGVDQQQKGAAFQSMVSHAQNITGFAPPEKLFVPPSNVSVIQGAGFAHGISKTVGTREAQVVIQEFLGEAISEIPEGIDFSRLNVGSEMILRVESAILPMLEMLVDFKKSTIESFGEISEAWVDPVSTHPVDWSQYFEGQIPELQASAKGAKGQSKATIDKSIKAIGEIQLIFQSLAGLKTGQLSAKDVDGKLREIQGYLDDVFAVTPPSVATQERLANISSVLGADIDEQIADRVSQEIKSIGSELQTGLIPMLEVLGNFKENIVSTTGDIHENYREAMSSQPTDWAGFLDFQSSRMQTLEPRAQGKSQQDVEKSRKALAEISLIFKQFAGLKTGELSARDAGKKLGEIQKYLDDVFAIALPSSTVQGKLENASSVLGTDIDQQIAEVVLQQVEGIGSELLTGLTPMLEVLGNFKENIIDTGGSIHENYREAMSSQPTDWSGFLDFESNRLERLQPKAKGETQQDIEKSRQALAELSLIFKRLAGLKTGQLSVKDADAALHNVRKLASTAFSISPDSPEMQSKLADIYKTLDRDTNQELSSALETRLQAVKEEVEREVGAMAEVVETFKFKQFDLELKDEDFIANTKIFDQNTQDWQGNLGRLQGRVNEVVDSPFAVEGFGREEREAAKRLKTLANQMRVLSQVKDPNTIEDIRKSLGRISPGLQNKVSPLQQPKFRDISTETLGAASQSLGIEDAVNKTRSELVRAIIKKLGSPNAIDQFIGNIQSGNISAAPELVQVSSDVIEEVIEAVQESAVEAVKSIAEIAPGAIRDNSSSVDTSSALSDVYEESKVILDDLVVPQLKELMRVSGLDSISQKREDLIKQLISSQSADELKQLSEWVKGVTDQGKKGGFRKIVRPTQSALGSEIGTTLKASTQKIEELLKVVGTQQGDLRKQTLAEIEKTVQETDRFIAQARRAKDATEKDLNQLKGYKGILAQVSGFDDIKAELTNQRSQTVNNTTGRQGQGLNAGLLGGGGALAALGAFGGGGGAAQAATFGGAAATATALPLLPLLGTAGGGVAALMGVRALRPIIERRYPEIAKIFYKDVDEMIREGGAFLQSNFRRLRRSSQQTPSVPQVESVPQNATGMGSRGAEIKALIEQKKAELKQATEKFKSEIAEAWERIPPLIRKPIETVTNKTKTFLRAFVGLHIFNALSQQLKQLIPVSLDVHRRFEVLEKTITFVAGSAANGARSLAFINREVDRTSIALEPAMKGYQQIAASARNTTLEASTDSVFSGVTQASGVLGLSSEDTSGAISAISQIIGKGVVSMEELRQQLGERIPGAMAIAARSMRMTEQELIQLVSTGQLTASEFIPKFARQLSMETAGGVAGAATTSQASINRLNNELLRFQKAVGEAIAPAQIAIFDLFAKALNLLGDNGQMLTQIIFSLSAVLSVFSVVVLGGAIKRVLVSTGAFKLLGSAINVVKANLASLAVATAAVFIAIEAIKIAFEVMRDGGKETREAFDDIEKSFNAIYAGTENAKVATESYASAWWDVVGQIKNVVREISKVPMPNWMKPDWMKDAASSGGTLGRAFLSNKQLKVGQEAQSVKEAIEGQNAEGGSVDRVRDVIEQAQKASGPIAEYNRLTEQIQMRELKGAGLAIDPTKNKQAIEQNKAEIAELQELRKKPEEELTGLQGVLGNLSTEYKKAQESFAANRSLFNVDLAETTGLNEQADQVDALSQKLAELSDNANSIEFIKAFALAMRELNIVMAESLEKSQIFESGANLQASQEAIAGFSTDRFGSRRLAAAQRSIQVASLKGQIPEQEAVIAKTREAISSPRYQEILGAAGIDENTSVARIRGMLQNIPESNKDLRNALEGLASMREAEQKLGQTRAALANAEYQDLIGREQDFMEALNRQAAEMNFSRQKLSNTGAIAVSEARMGGQFTESELNAISARNTVMDTEDQIAATEGQLVTLRKAFADGMVSMEAFSQKERELMGQSSDLSRQVAEQRVAAWQAGNQQIIQEQEKETAKVEHSIRRQQSARTLAAKQAQLLMGQSAEQTQVAIASAEVTATQARVTELEYLLSQNQEMMDKRIRTREEGVQREIQLEQQLDDAVVGLIDKQLQLRDLANQQAIRMAEERAAIADAGIRQGMRQPQIEIKQQQLAGDITSESASMAQTRNELDFIPKRMAEIQRKLEENKGFIQDRVRTVREGAQIERQLYEELGVMEVEMLDKQIQLRDLANQQAIRMAEERASIVQSQIRAATTAGSLAIKQEQLGGTLTAEAAGIKQTRNELALIPSRIAEIQRKLAENQAMMSDRIRTAREGAQIERQLTEELGNLQLEQADKRIQLMEKERETVNKVRESRISSAIEEMEQQKRANDLTAQSRDLFKQLAESRANLAKAERDYAKAQSSAQIAQTQSSLDRVARSRELLGKLAEAPGASQFRGALKDLPPQLAQAIQKFNPMEMIAKQLSSFGVGVNISQFEKLSGTQKRDAILIAELQLLEQQQALETQMAAQRREAILLDTQAMQQEHDLAQMMLSIDQERQAMAAKTAEFEAQIAIARAEQAQLTAEANVLQAAGGDPRLLAIAQKQYDLAGRGIALAQAQAEIARASANAQGELFGNAQNALSLSQAAQMSQQAIALYQHDGAEALRQQSAEMQKADIAAKAIARSSESTAQSAERATSAWSKAKELGSIKPENLPTREDIKAVREGVNKGDFSKEQRSDIFRATDALDRIISGPKDRQKDLISELIRNTDNPALLEALGIAERPTNGKSSRSAGFSNPITAGPLIPNAPINVPTTQPQTPAIAQSASHDPAFNELNTKVGKLLEVVQQMDVNSGAQQLNNAADKLINASLRPTVGQLYVTSPEPITDTAKIMSNLSNQIMLNEGL